MADEEKAFQHAALMLFEQEFVKKATNRVEVLYVGDYLCVVKLLSINGKMAIACYIFQPHLPHIYVSFKIAFWLPTHTYSLNRTKSTFVCVGVQHKTKQLHKQQ